MVLLSLSVFNLDEILFNNGRIFLNIFFLFQLLFVEICSFKNLLKYYFVLWTIFARHNGRLFICICAFQFCVVPKFISNGRYFLGFCERGEVLSRQFTTAYTQTNAPKNRSVKSGQHYNVEEKKLIVAMSKFDGFFKRPESEFQEFQDIFYRTPQDRRGVAFDKVFFCSNISH